VRNPRISPRYPDSDLKKVQHGAASFFIAGTGGPNDYEGKDMVSEHRGMNISGDEFLAVLTDSLKNTGH
jgi:hemoglobin